MSADNEPTVAERIAAGVLAFYGQMEYAVAGGLGDTGLILRATIYKRFDELRPRHLQMPTVAAWLATVEFIQHEIDAQPKPSGNALVVDGVSYTRDKST